MDIILTGTIFAAGVLVLLEIGRRIGEVGETASKGLGAFASRETGDALTKSGARSVLRVFGKGSKIRYVPAHPLARWICFPSGFPAADRRLPLSRRPLRRHRSSAFGPLKNPAGQGNIDRSLTYGAIYHCVLRKYALAAGVALGSFGPHALRTTPLPTRRIAAPTWAKCRNGSVMPTYPPHASTTAADPALRIARPSVYPTNLNLGASAVLENKASSGQVAFSLLTFQGWQQKSRVNAPGIYILLVQL